MTLDFDRIRDQIRPDRSVVDRTIRRVNEMKTAPKRFPVKALAIAAACVCLVAAVAAAILIPALNKAPTLPPDEVPVVVPSETDTPTPTPVTPTPATPTPPANDKSLYKRYKEGDTSIIANSFVISIPSFDDALKTNAKFVVVAKYIERDNEGHRYKFEIVSSYLDNGDVHEGDLLYTDHEPYDMLLVDTVTNKTQYLYSNLMGTSRPFKDGGEYILLGFYDRFTGEPTLFYGMKVPTDDIASARYFKKSIFNDTTGEFPPSEFQPDENTTAEDFLEYCINGIQKK